VPVALGQQSARRERGDDSVTSVLLKEYDPLWVSQFEADRNLISSALGGLAKRIEHVGSTSIPGMKAKPIIDIAVAVEAFLALDGKISKLEGIGYEYVPKIEFPNRRFFRRGQWGAGTHHLHIYELNSNEWNNIILFRDYLRTHPDTAREYMNLKQMLAIETSDRQTYTDFKGPFIQSVIEKAKACDNERRPS
jgi:GrpB-like predicted nucleotidyltransferase (UPF0157 family)